MTVAKKGGLGCLIVVALFVLPSFGYGLVTGGDAPGWLAGVSAGLALVFAVGGVIYLAVDAAIRHNRQD